LTVICLEKEQKFKNHRLPVLPLRKNNIKEKFVLKHEEKRDLIWFAHFSAMLTQ